MKKLIIGNWKMNGSSVLSQEFAECFGGLDNVIIAMPYPFIPGVADKMNAAAEDCSIFKGFGARTGEVSAEMLFAIGCRFVIVGHSERRQFFNELDNVVWTKMERVLEVGMTPILCIDHQAQIPDSELFYDGDVIIAYEPLSAIGTGVVPSLNKIEQDVELIKNKAKGKRVVYGGSVNSANARSILEIKNIDGVLIGGASLKKDEFCSIINSVTEL